MKSKQKFFLGIALIVFAISMNYDLYKAGIQETNLTFIIETIALISGALLVGFNFASILGKTTLILLAFFALEGAYSQNISFSQDMKLLFTEDSYQNTPPTIDILTKYTSKQKNSFYYSIGIEFADLKTPYFAYHFGIGKYYFDAWKFAGSIELKAVSVLHDKLYLPTSAIEHTVYFKIDKNIWFTQLIQILNRPDIDDVRASFYFGFVYNIKS